MRTCSHAHTKAIADCLTAQVPCVLCASVRVRRHLDLPKLPLGFLAEVYAHAKLKEADEGFEKAPGKRLQQYRHAWPALDSSSTSHAGHVLLKVRVVDARYVPARSLMGAGRRLPQLAPAMSHGPKLGWHVSVCMCLSMCARAVLRTGIHYLAEQLKAIAVNSSLPLLSLELEPADPSLGLVILSDADVPHAPPPRLKVRVDGRGGVDVSVRQGEVAAPGDPAARASALARQWAWPLPHVDLSSLVPFEALLRSILAAHPFNLDKVRLYTHTHTHAHTDARKSRQLCAYVGVVLQSAAACVGLVVYLCNTACAFVDTCRLLECSQVQKQGIQMKLTKSEITGTRMMAFEMEVRSRAEPPNENLPDHLRTAYNTRQDTSDSSSDDTSDTPDQEQLLVFDVLVSVKEKKRAKTGGDGAAGTGPQDFEYVPVSVKLKHVYGPTLAGTPGTLHAMLTGAANGTLPSIGFDDHEDLGIARQEAEQ